jgi:hypothetical protein
MFKWIYRYLRSKGKTYWLCGRCGHWPIYDNDKKCNCKKGAFTMAFMHTPVVSINVYIDTGNVYHYEVDNEVKAREHADAIIKTGYRSVNTDKVNNSNMVASPPNR